MMLCCQGKTILEPLFIKTNLDVLGKKKKKFHGAVKQEGTGQKLSLQATNLPSPRKTGQSLGWPPLSACGPHSGAVLSADWRGPSSSVRSLLTCPLLTEACPDLPPPPPHSLCFPV